MDRTLQFDPAPDARPLFKERVLWTLVMGLFFFLVYGSANQIAALTAPHASFYWDWETRIPFVPEFIVPYMSSDLVFVIAFALAPTREAVQKYALRCGVAIVISATFFVLMPLEFSFARPAVDGWTKVWFDALSLDQPYNQFPSLHISLGFVAWHVLRNATHGPVRWFVTMWFVAIASSTVLVYQHHAIDLLGGAVMVAAVFWMVPEKGSSRVPLNFVTPRHLHMALRYLIVSAGLTVCAFSFSTWGWLYGWAAIAMLILAAGYALGRNGVLHKHGRKHSWISWVLFWPYLLGSWLNWRFWRTKVALMAQVQPGLWLGARPGREDWDTLTKLGVHEVIDLVPELSATTPDELTHQHMPLLDIAIPSPQVLDDIAQHVDEAIAQGGVYIHCALGMSRSVLAVGAWMIRNGRTFQQALNALDEIRPERVRRPYMAISLKLYEEHLACRRAAAQPSAR